MESVVTLSGGDSGELLTLQRAAYVTEAQAHDDVNLPPLMQSLAELVSELTQPTFSRSGCAMTPGVSSPPCACISLWRSLTPPSWDGWSWPRTCRAGAGAVDCSNWWKSDYPSRSLICSCSRVSTASATCGSTLGSVIRKRTELRLQAAMCWSIWRSECVSTPAARDHAASAVGGW